MKYITSFLATGGLSDKDGILGLGTNQYQVNNSEFEKSIKILDFLINFHSLDEILEFEENNNIDNDIFNKLLKHKLILTEKEFVPKEDSSYFKNSMYFEALNLNSKDLLNKFKSTTFIIVGCGGIGNYMSYSLGSLSPTKMILIDGDTIEESNLNRQFLFSIKDIGNYKSDIIKRELEKRFRNINVDSCNKYVTKELLTRTVNPKYYNSKNCLVILSGDSDTAVLETTKFCTQFKIPFLNIGYLNDISVIGPFYIPNISSCPFCHNTLALKKKENSVEQSLARLNRRYESPANFTNNALSSSLAMSDIIQYKNGTNDSIKSLNKRIGIDNKTFEKYEINISKDDNCPYCGG